MLAELGRTNFQFPDLERFNWLLTAYRSAGQSSAFNLKTLLEWPEFPARLSALRILLRVSKDIFDVLAQSENLILTVNDFANSSPQVKDKAAAFSTQNLNSLELAQTLLQLGNYSDDPAVISMLKEEFRINVELLTLAGLEFPVCVHS